MQRELTVKECSEAEITKGCLWQLKETFFCCSQGLFTEEWVYRWHEEQGMIFYHHISRGMKAVDREGEESVV